MIKPTVGRIVWYSRKWPEEKLAAVIGDVLSDRFVSVSVQGKDGIWFPATSISLLQDGDEPPAEGVGHVRWMDWQKGSAAQADGLTGLIDALGKRVTELEALHKGDVTSTIDAIGAMVQRLQNLEDATKNVGWLATHEERIRTLEIACIQDGKRIDKIEQSPPGAAPAPTNVRWRVDLHNGVAEPVVLG